MDSDFISFSYVVVGFLGIFWSFSVFGYKMGIIIVFYRVVVGIVCKMGIY